MILRRIPSLPTWSSGFRELDEARREMERLFDSLSGIRTGRTAGVFPAMNVSEDVESIYVRAELPGFDTKNLDITIENDTLTISGKRERDPEEGSVSYHRREREWGAFRRSLNLPRPVEADKVMARYQDGVLTVVLPKAPEARPKQITVEAGS